MFDANFFRDTLMAMVREIPADQKLWVSLKLTSGPDVFAIHGVQLAATGFVVCSIVKQEESQPLKLIAFPYEVIEYVYVTAIPKDQPAPGGQTGEGFQVNPQTAN